MKAERPSTLTALLSAAAHAMHDMAASSGNQSLQVSSVVVDPVRKLCSEEMITLMRESVLHPLGA